jgi:chromosome segregation and condensation protein ScpB
MAVLAAIAAHPGASNRQVGRFAGVEDQGQMSKLLQRLQRHGLVANHTSGRHRGAPNAWQLTPHGVKLAESLALPGAVQSRPLAPLDVSVTHR